MTHEVAPEVGFLFRCYSTPNTRDEEASEEFRFSIFDHWLRQLFVALYRRYRPAAVSLQPDAPPVHLRARTASGQRPSESMPLEACVAIPSPDDQGVGISTVSGWDRTLGLGYHSPSARTDPDLRLRTIGLCACTIGISVAADLRRIVPASMASASIAKTCGI
jgi:hypothetical protein